MSLVGDPSRSQCGRENLSLHWKWILSFPRVLSAEVEGAGRHVELDKPSRCPPVHSGHHLDRTPPCPVPSPGWAPPSQGQTQGGAPAGSELSAYGTPGPWEILNDLLQHHCVKIRSSLMLWPRIRKCLSWAGPRGSELRLRIEALLGRRSLSLAVLSPP